MGQTLEGDGVTGGVNDFLELARGAVRGPGGQTLAGCRSKGDSARLRGLSGSFVALLLAGLQQDGEGVQVAICEGQEAAAYLYSDLSAALGEAQLLYFPSSYPEGPGQGSPSAEAQVQRNELVGRQEELGDAAGRLIVVTWLEAVGERIVSRESYTASILSIKVGERLQPNTLEELLADMGFTREDFVFRPGQYARRGSIVDIFSFEDNEPYRFDFLDDEVDSIRRFSVDTQLSTGSMDACRIIPLFTNAPTGGQQSILELLTDNATVWTEDWAPSLERYADQTKGLSNELAECFLRPEELAAAVGQHTRFELGLGEGEQGATVSFRTQPQPNFARNFPSLVESLNREHQMGHRTYIFAEQESQRRRLRAIFDELGLERDCYRLVSLPLHEGFSDADSGVNVYTDHQLFDRYHRYKLRKALPKRDAFTLNELQALHPGDYVVHVDHGVGRFEGFIREGAGGTSGEYVCLSYRDGDTLMVSIHNLHRLSKYRASDDEPPTIHKLGSGVWSRMKERVKREVKERARELIRLYAARRVEKGFAFSPDSYLQEQLEASFIFEDTPDQLLATRAVKQDMEADIPMDRLVCGDVGFGKTEIAVRAAFKAATDGKQVCVLVPTTVLALQHYKTFGQRLADFPVRVELLSRLRSAREQREVKQALAEGKVDILIGTHAILGKTVRFKDLGLLIVDEEQKFGVAAKEKLKQLRVNVDTLTLTATPIPRTLQFSLMGARDMSIINTPPPNRYPIATEVMMFDRARLTEAITRELDRGGQVFFVHNWVQNLGQIRQIVEEMVPGIRVGVAHGQMKPTEIEQAMLAFMDGEYDLLLSTSIVESGLDIPNANTMIVNNGHRFGLSDLHQLRGRVGRTNRKAYCYIVVPTTEPLTDAARRRLKALEDYSDLGSGMSIAMQDLDIRGAGNLLGAEQSGFIVDMGIETYQRILDEAMSELKLTEFPDLFEDSGAADGMGWGKDCTVETDLDISLPDEYVENATERMRLYREIDRLGTAQELEQYRLGLRDRFGPLPPQAEALMGIPPMKWLAASLGVEKLVMRGGALQLQFITPVSSPYYQGEIFGRILRNIQADTQRFRLRQLAERLRLDVRGVESVEVAMGVLTQLGKEQ
ncbi:MAG: transcription-repair coupling factor [Bacteroidia bacterium]|nr:MAG: transcription-repair coupling factor [Bacteroidia bacterium]